MDRLIYLAMTGAKQALQSQQNVANNLANANTPGFRADFDSLVSTAVQGPGVAARVYSVLEGSSSDLSPGTVTTTGNPLDVAIDGEGWIAVQAADGGEAYTRRGDFRMNAAGLLETGSGQLVLGNGGPIAIPPAEKIEVGVDGTISIVPLGQGANTLAVVDRIKLVNPPAANLAKGADGLFRSTDGQLFEADAAVRVVSGSLEGSNVNTVEALVKMIDAARGYETYVKLLTEAKQNDETGQRLLRGS